jgi:hypothetical protein
MRTPIRLIVARTLALSLLTITPPLAEAGPPAICHQFQTGGAPSLPWAEGSGWRRTVPTYDLQRLTDDTLRLLTPTTPVLARMETIRRATIYASSDTRVASELLSRVLGRAIDGVASGPGNRQALFDAGYLVESYRQANLIYKYEMLRGPEKSAWQLRETPKGLDGYSWIVSAIAMGPVDPEMEFGASRVTEGASSQAHVRKAITGARAGTPLASTLVAFGYRPAQTALR